jgi:septum formation protein
METLPMASDITSRCGTLILASASPRRQAFLRALGLPVRLHPADVDESPLPNESPERMTRRLASLKAETARTNLPSDPLAEPALLLGLDTTVVHAGDMLGRPQDTLEAESFLRRLRTGPHEVCTGYCLINLQTGRRRMGVHISRLTMRNYTDAEIDRYLRTGDPFDKAGGYALQDRDFDPVARLDGCAASVMGMPVHDLLQLLRDEAGWPVSRNFGAVCVRLTGRACCQTP